MIAKNSLYSLVFLLVVKLSQLKRYDDYKLLIVSPKSSAQVHALSTIKDYSNKWTDNGQVEFVTPITTDYARKVEIVVGPDVLKRFIATLRLENIEFYIADENIQKKFDKEAKELQEKQNERLMRRRRTANVDYAGWDFDFSTFNKIEDIQDYMRDLASKHSSLVSLHGKTSRTHENRSLLFLKIGYKNPDIKHKKAIWIEAGIHAREWISPAATLWIINELVTNGAHKELLEHIDFYIMPNTNPDGYAFSMAKDGDRLWRKNRSGPFYDTFDRTECFGVDLNRNWDFYFMEGSKSKEIPCSGLYRGSVPFSEWETFTVRNELKKLYNVRAYISLHSYSELLLYPYGLTGKLPASKVIYMANKMVAAIKSVHDHWYEPIPVSALYGANTTGTSIDWVAASLGVAYSFCLELRPEMNERHPILGFVVDSNQIKPTAEEVWAGIQLLATEIMNEKEH